MGKHEKFETNKKPQNTNGLETINSPSNLIGSIKRRLYSKAINKLVFLMNHY